VAFTFPDDISPDLYPLAWLLGKWRGYGILTYGEDVPEQAVYQEMSFEHDGGPYLKQTITIWTVDSTKSENLDFEMSGAEGASKITPAQVWSTETSYWRPVGQYKPEAPESASGPVTPITNLEIISADPAGHAAVWEGAVQGPRIELATTSVQRSEFSAELERMTRMYGLVNSELMWTQDMDAFGRKELKTYASGRLSRVEDEAQQEPEMGAALGERADKPSAK